MDIAGIETVLTGRAIALGVEIRRGCAVDAVPQGDVGVTVMAGGEAFRGSWLVGCDGGRSTVRKAIGIGISGTDPEFTGYSVGAELSGPDILAPGRHYTAAGMYTFTPPGTIAMVDFDGGAFHRSRPVTREHVEAVLRRVSGADVRVETLGAATIWTDRACQAIEYRRGRVLLAGDAAHVHSPLGGQGLNLGIGDAMNLGWKLAATIRGDAPRGLLDSYEDERAPVGAQILDWSRAQVALMRPTPSSRALEAIVRDLIGTRDGAAYFASRVHGLSIRYDLGGGHPLVGRSAPDLPLADGRRLNEHMRVGRGVLLDLGTPATPGTEAVRPPGGCDRLQAERTDRSGPDALRVRPDGIVAWAGGDDHEGELLAALSRWFGPAGGRTRTTRRSLPSREP